MEEKLTEQVLTPEAPAQTEPAPNPGDNIQMAEHLMKNLMQPFSESLLKLGNNELRKLIRLLVQFPFVDTKNFKLNDNQKMSFMLGERLVYANMVKRARAELERTFSEVEKEQNVGSTENISSTNAGESETESITAQSSGESSTSDGTIEAQGNSQV